MKLQVLRQLRRLHSYRASDPVEEELRGWSYTRPPVKPRRYLGLSMADVAYRYCPTKRDVYLRKVLNLQGEAREPLTLGKAVHEVLARASRDVSRWLSSGLPPYKAMELAVYNSRRASSLCPPKYSAYCSSLYEAFALDLLSDGSDSPLLPTFSEVRVDGTPLGLSPRLSVDAITSLSMVVEFKLGSPQDFHRLALAGYAMALESNLELPVDFGALVYVNGLSEGVPKISYEVYYISPDLRRQFIDARDEVVELISEEKDPGRPAVCPSSCPFYSYCNGGAKA
ncbi:MAG: type I-A CRISPR-associated protein Cas4/Csa1 [Thermoprotei archaeon]